MEYSHDRDKRSPLQISLLWISVGNLLHALYLQNESSIGNESGTGGSRWAYVAKEAAPCTVPLCTYVRTGSRAYLSPYTDDHVLVFWPEEDCVSVVELTDITAPCRPVVGQYCQVRFGRKEYKGVTMELGTYAAM